MALPIWLTWNLHMPRSKKVSVLCLFATGVICILFACLRVTQVAINAAKPEAIGQPLDPTWLAIWGMVECSIGMANFYPAIHVNAHFYQPLSLAAALRSPFSSKLCDRRTHTIHVATGGRPIATRIRKEGADWNLIRLGVKETWIKVLA